MWIRRLDFAILAAGTCLFLVLFAHSIPSGRFGYDESDYMYAVSKGFIANYTDSPSIPIADFIKKGLDAGAKRSSNQSLSDYIRSSDDITFYRHFHAPLYYYWVIAQQHFLGQSERASRWVSVECLLLCALVMYVGCLWLLKESGRIAAVIGSGLLLMSPANIGTAMEITPHNLYIVLVIASLFAMAKMIQTADLRYWYCSVAAVSVGLLTMEYSALLVLTLVLCAYDQRRALFDGWKQKQFWTFAVRSTGTALGIILVVWPAGLLKLTLLKNYIFFGYFSVMRAKAYGSDSFAHVWIGRIEISPFEYAFMVLSLAVAIYSVARRRIYRWCLPFVVYAVLLIFTTVRNKSPQPQYVSSLLPTLYALSGIVVAYYLRSRRSIAQATAALIICSLAFASDSHTRYVPSGGQAPSDFAINYFLIDPPSNRRLVVESLMVPPLHYYLPGYVLTPYSDASDAGNILQATKANSYDGVLSTSGDPRALRLELEKSHHVTAYRLTPDGYEHPATYFRLGPPTS